MIPIEEKLEPEVRKQYRYDDDAKVALLSIAISCKRIADTLENDESRKDFYERGAK